MKKKDVTGFVFQEVPLQEALNLTYAGKGHYSEVAVHLLEVLPRLTENAYAFGLPNGKEIDDSIRKNICMTVSKVLSRAGLSWKIVYSESRKLFVCIPWVPKSNSKTHNGIHASESKLEEIEAVACNLFNVDKAALHRKRVLHGFANVRYIIIRIALMKYGIAAETIASYFGLAIQSIWGSRKHAKTFPEHIEKLEAALEGAK